jgi:hypothetical protein
LYGLKQAPRVWEIEGFSPLQRVQDGKGWHHSLH